MTITTDGAKDDELPDDESAKEFYAKYEMKHVLGKGVSSTVRKCMHKKTKLEYAAKIIDLTGEKGHEHEIEEIRESTKKEIEILNMCHQQKNIIKLMDTFESPSFLFLVFELCPKGELFDYLTEVVTLSEKRTRVIMKQLGDAIKYIHDHRIVHRDIKPENILLDSNFCVKLSDFGFATFLKEDDEIMDLCGTPGYLAPEVLKVSMYENAPGYGRPVDMWACGVCMYTLLVGCPPFWHRKQMMMLRSIMEGNYSMTGPMWEDIGEQAKDMIRKLLTVDPGERMTANELLQHNYLLGLEDDDQLVVHAAIVRRLSALPIPPVLPSMAKIADLEGKRFSARKVFKGAAYVIIATVRIRNLHLHPPPLPLKTARRDPYSLRLFRKVIDAGAFRIYGHWVKRGENQNRAALFEMGVKKDLQLSQQGAVPGMVQVSVQG